MRQHIIFDCDDVLLDWMGGFKAFLPSVGFSPDPAGPDNWDMSGWIGTSPSHTRKLVAYFNHKPEFSSLKAIPGAKEKVWDLNAKGHSCHVLSSCGDDNRVTTSRRHNLFMHFNRVRMGGEDFAFKRITTLPLGGNKLTELRKWPAANTVFVEDNFQNALSGALLLMKTYCIRKPHNRADEAADAASGVIWIDDINEVQP